MRGRGFEPGVSLPGGGALYGGATCPGCSPHAPPPPPSSSPQRVSSWLALQCCRIEKTKTLYYRQSDRAVDPDPHLFSFIDPDPGAKILRKKLKKLKKIGRSCK